MPTNPTVLLPDDCFGLTYADKANIARERKLGMVAPDSPVLNGTSQQAEIGSINVHQAIEKLEDAALGQRDGDIRKKNRRILVGLAAPQIGKPLRIILVDIKVQDNRKSESKPVCFINPEIIWRSKETGEGREGCFSAGLVWGLVRRPIAVKVRAWTPEGKKIEKVYEDFTARIFQHEIDHLDGIRFPDRIRYDSKRHWVHAEEMGSYPKLIHHWKRLCSLERWEATKNGIVLK